MLYGITRRVDEANRVRSDRDSQQGVVIGREAHSMDKQLATVERA